MLILHLVLVVHIVAFCVDDFIILLILPVLDQPGDHYLPADFSFSPFTRL